MGMPVAFDYQQLSSWAWYYAQAFSHNSLPGHWSAFRYCADVRGLAFPLSESVCWRRMKRVMRALKLADPTEVVRCFPLIMAWLRRMMAADGIGKAADVSRLPLRTLSFWTRVMVSHCAMLRGCEHKFGMRGADLRLAATPNEFCQANYWGAFYKLQVGRLPDSLQPKDAANRKLKLRPAREAILPVWESLSSAGFWMWELTQRLSHLPTPPASMVLFPDALDDVPSKRPMTIQRFMQRLKICATRAGMPADSVKKLEIRSLRAGGCTDAHANCMPRAAIMRQGGWLSDAVDIYNRPTERQRWQSFAKFWAVKA